MAIRVIDPSELDFPFTGAARFRGLEGERSQLCDAALVKKTYLSGFRRHREEFEASCRSLCVQLATLTSDQSLEHAVVTVLKRRR